MKLEISDIADASGSPPATCCCGWLGAIHRGFLRRLGSTWTSTVRSWRKSLTFAIKMSAFSSGRTKSNQAPRDRSVPALLIALSALERRETSKRNSEAVQDARARGSSLGRPLVMTPERRAIAMRMLLQGRRGPQILKVICGLEGPNISQSAYYLWQKAWLAKERGGTHR